MIVKSLNRVGYGSVGGNVGYARGRYGYAFGDQTPVAVTPTATGTAGVVSDAVPGILNTVLDLIGLKPKSTASPVVVAHKTPTWVWIAAGVGVLAVGGTLVTVIRRRR